MKKIIFLSLLSLPLFFLAQTNKQHTSQQLKEKEVEIQKKKSETKNLVVLPPLNEIITIGSKAYDLVKANGTLSKYKAQSRLTKPKSNPKVTYHYSNKVTTSTLTPCDPVGISITASSPFPVDPTVDDETYFDANGFNLQLPFTFCFYGNSYTEVNYSSNGNIQLGTTNETAFSSVGFPVTNTLMIAPFWADLDNQGVGQYLIDVFPTYAVFTWTNCGYYSSKTDKTNSFQLVITDGLDPILPIGKNVGFYYYDMQWTTGDFGGNGTNGFPTTQPGIPATVGVNAGNGIDFIQLGRFGLPGAFYDGPGGGNDGIDWLDNKKFYFDLCPATGTNIDPQPTLISCDTLKVCGDDTLTVTNSFLAPEIGQNVTITVSAPTLGSALSFTVVPNSGSSDVVLSIDGLNAASGYHTVTISATDDGAPALTIVQQLIVSVNQTVPIASIFGNLNYCLPSEVSTVLTATNISTSTNQDPLTYNWTGTGTLSSTATDVITVNEGVYTVTITNQFGCPSVATTTVTMSETPNYNLISTNAISGGSVYCVNQDTARIAISFGSGAPAGCGLASSPCLSSNTVQIGTAITEGSVSDYTPFNGVWESAKHQYLIRANELLSAGISPGKLNSLAFKVTNLNGNNSIFDNFSIKLKCVSYNTVAAPMDNSGLIQVYGPTTANTSVGLNTYNFTQAYEWDGVSNLLVDVCWFNLNWDGNISVEFTNVGYNATLNKDADNVDQCPLSTIDATSQNRPNIIFGNCLSQQTGSQFNVVVTPTTGVVIPASNDSIKIDLPATAGITCYTVSLINQIGNCAKDTIICVEVSQGITIGNLSFSQDSVCPGAPVTISGNGAILPTYTITYGTSTGTASVIGNSVTVTPTLTTSGFQTYTLTAEGACGGVITDFIDSVKVYLGTTQATLSVSTNTLCPGNSVTLSALGTLASYTIAYVDANGNLQASVNNSVTIVASNIPTPVFGIHTYSLIAQGPCSGPITVFTDSVEVMQGVTNATLVSTQSVVCIGSPITLSPSGTAMATYTIQYNNGAGVMSSNNASAPFNTAVGGINTYSLIAQGFCSAPIDTFTVSVLVNNLLNLSITPMANVTKCLNGTVTLTANVASSSAQPYTYNWSPAVGTNTNSTYSTSTAVTTTYVVTVNGTCANTATSSVVVSNFATDINVLITDSAVVCAGKELVLHSLTTGGKSPYTYNWTIVPDINSVSSSSSLNTTAPTTQGTYTVMVVSTDSCGFIDFDTQLITVLPPCTIEVGNIITPNGDGANDLFKIKNLEYHPNTVLTIYDRWGRKVYENQNYANDWKAEGLADGTYFYVLDVPEDKAYNGFVQVLR